MRARRTNVLGVEDRDTAGMQVLELRDIVNLSIHNYPLRNTTSVLLPKSSVAFVLTRSSGLLCYAGVKTGVNIAEADARQIAHTCATSSRENTFISFDILYSSTGGVQTGGRDAQGNRRVWGERRRESE